MEFDKLAKEKVLTFEQIKKSRIQFEQIPFVSIGGGIGSFCWIDALRIHGVSKLQIAVISKEVLPYQQFRKYCENSGLTQTDRLRSDSSARPDNFWGYPGYGISECLEQFRSAKLGKACKTGWQIFTEPILSDFYTPTTNQVYKGIDREAKRIGWNFSLRLGEALYIRKVSDGRFAVFYKNVNKKALIICNFLHLSVGHNIKPLELPLSKKANTLKRIFSIYENHQLIYRQLKQNGGKVVVIGRGITAAKAVDKLIDLQNGGAKIEIISLFRTNLEDIKKHGFSKQENLQGWRLQSFNWPRASFGGKLMENYINADEKEKPTLSSFWSKATTPPRKDWIAKTRAAMEKGQYKILAGNISKVSQLKDSLLLTLNTKSFGESKNKPSEKPMLETNFVIDCTGFSDSVKNNSLYGDLVNYYKLPLSFSGGFKTNIFFEIEKMATENGAVFVTGSGAAGNAYGPVDSFFGQQYAALKSIEKLESVGKFRVGKLNALTSALGWLKWSLNHKI